MLIDTHTHIVLGKKNDEYAGIIKRAHDSNTWLVNIGTTLIDSKDGVEIAKKYEEGVYCCVGVHPDVILDAESAEKYFNLEMLKKLAQSSEKVVAIGEVGLDYYRTPKDKLEIAKEVQKKVFIQCLKLAQELDLALVIHARGEKENPYQVYDEVIQILEEYKPKRVVAHCFGGSVAQAQKLASLDCLIGVTGIVTFKNAFELQNVVKMIPLESIVLETDAPFLAPEPHRGQTNEASYLKFIAQKVADLRNISFDDVARETTINARRLYII